MLNIIPSTFQYMKSGTNCTHQFKKYEYHYNVMNIIKIVMKRKDATLLEVEDACFVACLRHSLGAMATSDKVTPWSEPWAAIQTSLFPGIRDKPQLNLNPLRDSFCKPKFRTVPDVSGPVEGMQHVWKEPFGLLPLRDCKAECLGNPIVSHAAESVHDSFPSYESWEAYVVYGGGVVCIKWNGTALAPTAYSIPEPIMRHQIPICTRTAGPWGRSWDTLRHRKVLKISECSLKKVLFNRECLKILHFLSQ